MTDKKQAYLGDGVYASFDGYHIWLTTQRALREDRIALEPEVYQSLQIFAKTIGMKND